MNFFIASSDARRDDSAKSDLNSLKLALPVPVTAISVTGAPVASVTLHTRSTVKSVGGHVSALDEDDVVVKTGLNTKAGAAAPAGGVAVSSLVTLAYTSLSDL